MSNVSVRYNDDKTDLVCRLWIVIVAIIVTCIFPSRGIITVGVNSFQSLDRYHHHCTYPLLRDHPKMNRRSLTNLLPLCLCPDDGSLSFMNSIPNIDELVIHDTNLMDDSRQQQQQHLNPKTRTIVPPAAARDDNRFVTFGNRDDSNNNNSNVSLSTLISSSSAASASNVKDEIFARVADPYGWMRDDLRSSTVVLQHIEAENSYTQQQTRHLTDLQETLEREYHRYSSSFSSSSSTGSIEDVMDIDVSSVYCQDGYAYYTRRVDSQPYALHCRSRLSCNPRVGIRKGDRNEIDSTTIDVIAPPAAAAAFLIDFPTETILLDENILVQAMVGQNDTQQQYFALHTILPSPSHDKIAYSVDVTGGEVYQVYIMEIDTGNSTLIDTATSGTLAWGVTDDVLYYIRFDSSNLRPCQWMEWTSLTSLSQSNDTSRSITNGVKTMVLEEPDERFWCGLRKSSDGKSLFWICESSGNRQHRIAVMDLDSRNVHYIEAPITSIPERPSTPSTAPTPPTTAFVGSWYDIEHSHGTWWIVANGNNQSSTTRLYTKVQYNKTRDWTVVDWMDKDDVARRVDDVDDTFAITSIHTFVGHVVVQGRRDGLPRIWILTLEHDNPRTVMAVTQLEFDEETAHYVSVGRNQEYWSTRLVITFESMVSPPQVLAIDLNDSTVRHVLYRKYTSDYKQELYGCERRYVPCRDGSTRIPISVVYRKDAFKREKRPSPIHLFAYGAYGHSLEAAFSTIRLSLLNRGVVCVVAHVRGGGENGQLWHELGKCKNKMNSIDDLLDVARWFIDNKWTTSDMLVCEGRSAGGLLVAAAVNESPSLFRAAVLGVPFLDPIGTMADSSLPLTTVEWEEWGDPHRPNDFANMCRWSPMQNVGRNDVDSYPNMLLLGGLYDPRVPYWEPLKYAATIRHASANVSTPCCVSVKIDTSAGHSFGGDRNKYYRELSFIYAFVLDQMGRGGAESC
jgi:oligopeptidase B